MLKRTSIALIVVSFAIGAAVLSEMRSTTAGTANGLASVDRLDGHVSSVLIAMGVAGAAFFLGLALLAGDMLSKWHRRRSKLLADIAHRQTAELATIRTQTDASRGAASTSKPPSSK